MPCVVNHFGGAKLCLEKIALPVKSMILVHLHSG